MLDLIELIFDHGDVVFGLLGAVAFILVLKQRRVMKQTKLQMLRLMDRVRLLEEASRSQTFTAPAMPQPESAAPPVTEPVAVSPPQEEAEPAPAPPPQPEPAIPVPPRPPRRSLEEALGTRWTVWVGGLALGLGALLLVRYSIEQGFFGPGARILFGLMLAAGLIAGGEVLRRRQRDNPTTGVNIPAVLTACGVVAAFGAIYSAYAVYGFIGSSFAFIILAAIGIACMLASALHGPQIAALGLLASFVTPILVSSNDPNPWALTLYLAVVSAAAHGLARLRRWTWLSISTACGALIWLVLMWIALVTDNHPVSIFEAGSVNLLIQASLAIYMLAYAPFRDPERNIALFDKTACLIPIIFAIFAEYWLSTAGMHEHFGAIWIITAVALPLALALASLASRPTLPLFAVAGVFVLAIVDGWPGPVIGIVHPVYWQVLGFVVGSAPLSLPAFAIYGGAMSLGLSALAARRMLRDDEMSFAEGVLISAVGALTPLGVLVIAWWRIGLSSNDFLFAALAALLAAVFVFAATVFRQALAQAGERDRDRVTFGLGIAASASFAALALSLVFALNGGTLTVAIALAALGCAYVSARLGIPALRWCVAGFALAIAARLAWDPRIVGADLGKTFLLNWLLFGYGVPALARGIAARIMRKAAGEDTPVRIAQAACILLSGFLVLFEIRHTLYDGDILAARSSLIEQGLNTFAALGFAAVLTRLDAAQSSIVFRIASYGFGIVSLAGAVLGLGIQHNPFLFGDTVRGGAVVNTLLLGYALPAIAVGKP